MTQDVGRVPQAEPGSREPDPQAVPALTGFDPIAQEKWRCGHARTPENTKIVRAGKGTACKACFRELNRNYMRAKRARAQS